jgi:hypothetical protein
MRARVSLVLDERGRRGNWRVARAAARRRAARVPEVRPFKWRAARRSEESGGSGAQAPRGVVTPEAHTQSTNFAPRRACALLSAAHLLDLLLRLLAGSVVLLQGAALGLREGERAGAPASARSRPKKRGLGFRQHRAVWCSAPPLRLARPQRAATPRATPVTRRGAARGARRGRRGARGREPRGRPQAPRNHPVAPERAAPHARARTVAARASTQAAMRPLAMVEVDGGGRSERGMARARQANVLKFQA